MEKREKGKNVLLKEKNSRKLYEANVLLRNSIAMNVLVSHENNKSNRTYVENKIYGPNGK